MEDDKVTVKMFTYTTRKSGFSYEQNRS